MDLIINEIIRLLRSAGISGKIELVKPPKQEMGDLAFACFDFAREKKMNPAEVAKELSTRIKPDSLIQKTEPAGPYLNFFLNEGEAAKIILAPMKAPKKSGKKIMVEYSQPNTHKEFHVGHLRNACIGGAVVELLKFSGQKVISANYIGDIGAHVAKCLWYIDNFKMDDWPKENLGAWIGRMYSEGTRMLEENPGLKEQVDEVLRKLESRDKKWTTLWKKTKQANLDDFKEKYKLLGNKFDVWFFESEVEKRGKEIVGEMLKKKIAQKGEGGAIIVDLTKYDLDIFMLLKSDGASLYATKDLALAETKVKKYKVDESLVIIDTRQSFYFKQLFKTLDLYGLKNKFSCLTYEFVRLPEGAMSSRHGNVVLFDDVYAEVLTAVRSEVESRHSGWTEKNKNIVARTIALAAIKFAMLKHPTDKVIEFNTTEAVSFDGFTGPYVLYTIARINSIIRKAGGKIKSGINYSALSAPEEKALLMKIGELGRTLNDAALTLDPSAVARYAFDLAKIFNDFYNKCPVLNAKTTEQKNARLALVFSAVSALKESFARLNIETVEEM